MPRQPRLDAPGALHHVIGRGIERTNIFRNQKDRADFVNRLAALCQEKKLIVYAWALLDNHFHILARTGLKPLATSMRRLLTGYVVNFNKRHQRVGHLFQNRYKSILCEDDPYLLELVRYIHLNPLRAGLVKSLADLEKFTWSGHSALLGAVNRNWQDQDEVLSYFGSVADEARIKYQAFVSEGVKLGERPELVGGGLIRSLGDWSAVVSKRRKGEIVQSDPRILGDSDFVNRILAETDSVEKETLRLNAKKIDLPGLVEKIAANEDIDASLICSGIRKRNVVKVRRVLCQIAVRKMGYSGAEVARFLGISTSAVNRLAWQEELPECKLYVNKLF